MDATVDVDAGHGGPLIPPTVFGTFLEPIGHSIYGGLWAQVLANPSFEANLWSAGDIAAMIKADPDLAGASRLGLPLPWEPLDPHQGNRYEPRWGDAANSYRSLFLMGLPDAETGVRQKVYLPAYRTLRYTGAIYVKSGTPAKVEISLRRRSPAAVLARAELQVNGSGWQRYPFTLELPSGAAGPLEPVDFAISLPHDNRVLIDQVSLDPADAIDGMDPEMIQLARAMKTPLLRYGGNFTSAYHWRDGIGPMDKRVSMLNIAWGMPEYNQFGTDEFLQFCRLIGAEPQIALNLGSGTPREAADWVRYVDEKWNGGRGALVWELGNELWGNWQVGYPTIDQIAARTKRFSEVVRAVDSRARLIATGRDPDNYSKWNAAQLSDAEGAFNFLSTHFVVGSENLVRQNPSEEFSAEAAFALAIGLEHRLHQMSEQIRSYAWARDRVKTAFTEWLFWAPPDARLPRYDNMGGAICTGGFLNMLLRNADLVPISDMTGLVEFGGIWKKRGRVFGTPAYYVFRMYSGTQPHRSVEARTTVASYGVDEGNRRIPDIENVPWLDVSAALDATGHRLMLYCVNRSLKEPIAAQIRIAGFKPEGDAAVSLVRASSIYDRNTEEQPAAITTDQTHEPVSGSLGHTFAPASVTVISLEGRLTSPSSASADRRGF